MAGSSLASGMVLVCWDVVDATSVVCVVRFAMVLGIGGVVGVGSAKWGGGVGLVVKVGYFI